MNTFERAQKSLVLILLTIAVLVGPVGMNGVYAEKASHFDKAKNQFGCSACHSGHGKKGTPMLRKFVPDLCFDCHSPFGEVLTSASTDIYYEFQKPHKHPVKETAQFHRSNEILPEESVVAPRHVSCLDCHNHHLSEKSNPIKGVKGMSASKVKGKAKSTSEVCYKCHADSANRPPESTNVLYDFDPGNTSFHPVEMKSKGKSISIISGAAQMKIECTDCHEPHGSDHDKLLILNYDRYDGVESPYAYELCYLCHRRESILNNESFKGNEATDYGHKEHVVYQQAVCNACHAPHGSRDNQSLIRFDPDTVSGTMLYTPIGGGRATCVLTCHDKAHE